MLELHAYQREAINSVWKYWANTKGNPLIVAPCGAGKSIILSQFICEVMGYGGTRVLVLSHRKELLQQDEAELRRLWPEAPTGFYSSGLARKDSGASILFAGIQTVFDKLHTFDSYDLVIIDEAHLIPRKQATMYGKALDVLRLMNPRTRYIGLTATPFRLDSGLLHDGDGALFDRITYDIGVRHLIERGHLCEVIGKRGTELPDISGVKKRGGEFIGKDVAAAMDVSSITQAACDEIVAYGRDRKAWLIFAAGVEHAEHICESIKGHGIDAEVVHGGIDKASRAECIERFKAGRLRCLVNVDILTVGFNAQICDMGVLLRATASTALYVQIVGRLMRTYSGKKNALLLDYGGNVERHGPIDQVEPKKPGKGGGEAPAKACPECHSILHASALSCPDCGHVFPPRQPKHESTAYAGAIMSHQIAGEWVRVKDVRYARHTKPGKPDSMRVEYKCGLRIYKEWFLPEHSGRARIETAKKLRERYGLQCPKTTNELLRITCQFPCPEFILVKQEGKYDNIKKAHFGSQEPTRAGCANMA